MPEFKTFSKIPRLSRECIITEKIDGTNAQILITESGMLFPGSRHRWITPGHDNFGFAKWVTENNTELFKLGIGTHYGEWWGQGIQRNYGLKEKRFSLFNTTRWNNAYKAMLLGYENDFPKCCHVVPILYKGLFTTDACDTVLSLLRYKGSAAVEGFMNPEGIVIFHVASNTLFKKTIKNDEGKEK